MAASTTSRAPVVLARAASASASVAPSTWSRTAAAASARPLSTHASSSSSSSSVSAASSSRDARRALSHSAAAGSSSSAIARAALAQAVPPRPESTGGLPPASSSHTTPTHLRPARSNRALTPIPDLPTLRAWFATRFPALALPDAVLLQLITHESHNMGRRINDPDAGAAASRVDVLLHAGAHNRRLSFLGRRALDSFLALFLHSLAAGHTGLADSSNSSGSSSNGQEVRRAAEELLRAHDPFRVILHTSRLGGRPGRALQLEEVMRWTSPSREDSGRFHEQGLFTIRGRTLEAFIGAVFHQHGAKLASQIFHVYVLPHVDSFPPNTPRALWDAIRERAEVDARALGELEGWAAQRRAELGYAPVAAPAAGPRKLEQQ